MKPKTSVCRPEGQNTWEMIPSCRLRTGDARSGIGEQWSDLKRNRRIKYAGLIPSDMLGPQKHPPQLQIWYTYRADSTFASRLNWLIRARILFSNFSPSQYTRIHTNQITPSIGLLCSHTLTATEKTQFKKKKKREKNSVVMKFHSEWNAAVHIFEARCKGLRSHAGWPGNSA